MATQLDDIPRQQLVKISVRTVTDEGQSPDPKKIVVINPREITQLFKFISLNWLRIYGWELSRVKSWYRHLWSFVSSEFCE